MHYDLGAQARWPRTTWTQAAEELEIASKYDPSNKSAADDLAIVRARIQQREDEKQRGCRTSTR